MIVVATAALIAILRREPEADGFLWIIVESRRCLVLSVSVLEAYMVLAGRQGNDVSWIGLARNFFLIIMKH